MTYSMRNAQTIVTCDNSVTKSLNFEIVFHNSSSVWGIVLAVAARKIYLLGNLFLMAEGNKPSVPKK